MRKIIKEAVDFGKVAEKAVAIIKGKGYDVIMFTNDGMETSDPEESRRLYVKDPNFMITVDEDAAVVRINKNSNVELDQLAPIMKQIKNLAREYMLKSELKVFGKEITPKDFAYQAKKLRDNKMNGISEASLSRMKGSKKTSYQTLESTKLIVRHKKAVDEDVRGSRSRQIKAIFIERAGERFKFPHNNLAGARAMARHIDEGGAIHDDVGKYIIESVGNMIKLAEFVRYSRTNKLINEDSEDIVKIVRENINAYRKELQRFQGATTYAKMCEKIADREGSELEEDTADLKDMFTVRKFDEKIGDTLPLIKRLVTEKNAWRSMIEEASEEAFVVTSTEELIEGDVVEFDSPAQKLGYKLRTLSERVIEESDLSKFVHKISNKIIEGAELSKFERSVMRNVLEHVVVVEEEAVEDDGFIDRLEETMNDFERKLKLLEFDLDWDDELEEARYDPQTKKDCPECGDFSMDLADSYGDEFHYVCNTCGYEESDSLSRVQIGHDIAPEDEVEEARYDPVEEVSGPCRWWAMCDNDATTTEPHPILGDVPICDRCVAKLRKIEGLDEDAGSEKVKKLISRSVSTATMGERLEKEFGMTADSPKSGHNQVQTVYSGEHQGVPFEVVTTMTRHQGDFTELLVSPGDFPTKAAIGRFYRDIKNRVTRPRTSRGVGPRDDEGLDLATRSVEKIKRDSNSTGYDPRTRFDTGESISEDDWDDEVRRGESEAGCGMGYPENECWACEGTGNQYGPGGGEDCEACDGTGVLESINEGIARMRELAGLEPLEEGYTVMPNIDRERYTDIDGLEGPFQAKNGAVYYYDPREGKYYDRDRDMYFGDDEFRAMDEGGDPYSERPIPELDDELYKGEEEEGTEEWDECPNCGDLTCTDDTCGQ